MHSTAQECRWPAAAGCTLPFFAPLQKRESELRPRSLSFLSPLSLSRSGTTRAISRRRRFGRAPRCHKLFFSLAHAIFLFASEDMKTTGRGVDATFTTTTTTSASRHGPTHPPCQATTPQQRDASSLWLPHVHTYIHASSVHFCVPPPTHTAALPAAAAAAAWPTPPVFLAVLPLAPPPPPLPGCDFPLVRACAQQRRRQQVTRGAFAACAPPLCRFRQPSGGGGAFAAHAPLAAKRDPPTQQPQAPDGFVHTAFAPHRAAEGAGRAGALRRAAGAPSPCPQTPALSLHPSLAPNKTGRRET